MTTGTLALLSQSERARIKGFVINRFRGDPALLQAGLEWLEKLTGKPVIGVLPYLQGLHLEAEDALPRQAASPTECSGSVRVVVPAPPRISNHTDFDPLRLHPQVDFRYIGAGERPPPADLIILPGSKSVRSDLEWLRAAGWEPYLQHHLRYGGKLIGICGGYQMLGRWIDDPHGLEGQAGSSAGFGLLDLVTRLEASKQLHNVKGTLVLENAPVTGYEIHAGLTTGPACKWPAVFLPERNDGALSDDGRILGTYLHGLFESTAARNAMLRWAGLSDPQTVDYQALRELHLERLADALEAHLNLDFILRLLEPEASRIKTFPAGVQRV